MTNLELINQYLYRAWKGNKLIYKLPSEMFQSFTISPYDIDKEIEKYLKLSEAAQLSYWRETSKHVGITLNVINATLEPLVKRIFGEPFKEFLIDNKLSETFANYAFSQQAQKWRRNQNYGIFADNLNDYVKQCTPTYYIYRCWLWRDVDEINGIDLNDKWMNEMRKILLKDFHF